MAGNASAAPIRVADRHDALWPFDTRQVTIRRAHEGNLLPVTLYSPTYHVGAQLNGLTVTVDSRGASYADYKLHRDFDNDGDECKRFTIYRMNGRDYLRAVSCQRCKWPRSARRGNRRLDSAPLPASHQALASEDRDHLLDPVRRQWIPRGGKADGTSNNGFAR